jgi:hypothetical protein
MIDATGLMKQIKPAASWQLRFSKFWSKIIEIPKGQRYLHTGVDKNG